MRISSKTQEQDGITCGKEEKMADKKLVEAITSMNEDFAQWYTDVVKKAELIDYSNVKGCMVIKPAGYAIWESIQRQLDERFKAVGVENVYMPMFIPESLLEKEKDHVEGFAPEVAWVTHGGLNPLQERMCVRPTSETLFCDFYKGDIHSYRDLPRVYNQWCSVVRWEKETRPFLRSREFLWQEGHTAHATAGEAQERTEQMLNVYADFCEEVLAIPVIKGRKTEKEKFAGAEATYTIFFAVLPQYAHLSDRHSCSKGMHLLVTPIFSFICSSHSLSPHHMAFTKPDFSEKAFSNSALSAAT